MFWRFKEFFLREALLARILAVLSLLAFSAWGFGLNWVPAILLSCCWVAFATKCTTFKTVFLALLAAIVLAIFPSLGMLYGVAIVTIWFTTKDISLSASPLALWLIEEIPIQLGCLPLNPLLRLILITSLWWLFTRNKKLIWITAAACLSLTIVDILKPTRFDSIEDYNDIGSGYKPGFSTLRNLGRDDSQLKIGKRPLRGYLHGSKIPANTPGVVMVEHDQWVGRENEPIASHNLQVDVPWHDNCWPGRQYLRFAIAKDGFLCSNLGGALNQDGRVELSYWNHGRLEPVLVSRGDTTWSADSDHFNNSLTIYNRCYLPELNREGLYYYLVRLVNVALVFIVVFSINLPQLSIVSIFLVLGSSLLSGDIRIAGGIGDPHDEGGPSGVADMINSTGKVALPGTFGAKILIIPHGCSAIHFGEKIVILGGGSTLYSLTEGVIKTDTIPLGTVKNIIDARSIIISSNKNKDVEVTLNHGTKVIGTSSPGRLSWISLFE
jgi:hypothetical protein